MSESLYELPKNCDFTKVNNASNQEFECSPKLANKFFSKFHGLLINAPDKVVWPKNLSPKEFLVSPSGTTRGPLRLMLSGLARIKHKEMGLEGEASAHVLVVAVDQKTAQTFSGKMPKPDYALSKPPKSSKPELTFTEAEKNALITSHFNFDLVHDLEIPIADATYTVYATLGDFKSNVLTIETQVEK